LAPAGLSPLPSPLRELVAVAAAIKNKSLKDNSILIESLEALFEVLAREIFVEF